MGDETLSDREPVKSYQSAAAEAGFYIDDQGDGWVIIRMANGDIHSVKADDPDEVEAVIEETFANRFSGSEFNDSDTDDDNDNDNQQ